MNDDAPTSVSALASFAAGTGEIVTITYNGGSHPGQPRQAVLITLAGDDVVISEPGVAFQKHYKLSKIASIELSNGTRAENPGAIRDPEPSAPALETLAQYAEHYAVELRAAGWNVISTETQLAVGGFYKNGKPRRSAVVSIEYVEPVGQLYVDTFAPSDELAVQQFPATGHERPWRVDSPRYAQTKTYKDIRAAMTHFLDEVRAHKVAGP